MNKKSYTKHISRIAIAINFSFFILSSPQTFAKTKAPESAKRENPGICDNFYVGKSVTFKSDVFENSAKGVVIGIGQTFNKNDDNRQVSYRFETPACNKYGCMRPGETLQLYCTSAY